MMVTGIAVSPCDDTRRRSEASADQKIYYILCTRWRRCHGQVPRRLWQISAGEILRIPATQVERNLRVLDAVSEEADNTLCLEKKPLSFFYSSVNDV